MTFAIVTAEAGRLCENGLCFNCDGAAACTNGQCTCNGAAVPKASFFPQPKRDDSKRRRDDKIERPAKT
jgi:hypothetical protein